ncbi:MAG: hypothetical protein JRH11_05890 [Deltaproteobacteria bacterium]|nr:hypothetical protein [Deltaproteobacteria bacterium]
MNARDDGEREGETQEPAYTGPVGKTRREQVHVTIPGGHLRSIPIYVAVDVKSDPGLKEGALGGALHRFEGGEELAMPFIYHDPDARKMALVIPETLRHRELLERARFLERLGADTDHEVPRYVREAAVVIGAQELLAYVERKAPPQDGSKAAEEAAEAAGALAIRESELDGRNEQLSEREERLHTRAEDVTRREDEVRSAVEMFEVQQRDLEVQQQELARRLDELQQRERELAERAKAQPRSLSSAPPPAAAVEEAEDDDIEELEEIDSISTNTAVIRAEDVEMVDDDDEHDDHDDHDDDRSIGEVAEADDGAEVDDDDEIEELDESDMMSEEVTGITLAPQEPESDDSQSVQSGSYPRAAVTPPEHFLSDRHVEMAAKCDGAVWLFARLDEGREDAYRGGAELLAQLVVVKGCPVVVLALVENRDEGRPFVRRVVLDPRDVDDRSVLESLRADFEATVALFGPSGRFERTVEVAAPRRVNVAMILERVSLTKEKSAQLDTATAKERALAVPPPIKDDGHPFLEEVEAVHSAAEAANALAQLVVWTTSEKLNTALLVLSIPGDLVDGATRQILANAVDRGLALTPELTTRALAVGVAPDEGALVIRQLECFRETTADEDSGGLSAEDVADNWEQLLEAANENEIAVDGPTHERAWSAIRTVRGDATGEHAGLAEVDAAKLPDMGKPELVMLMDHPKHRLGAALELCKREDPEMLQSVYKAVRKMSRTEVVRIVPRIVDYGETSGDALIDGLSARKTFVRQASALGLGEVGLRRAVVPLAHLLLSEDSDVWPEVARVLGGFGRSAFRQVARLLKDPKGRHDRLKVTLGHLANHGCEDKVEALAKESDKATAVIAIEAMTLRHDLKRLEQQILSDGALSDPDPVLNFSRRFYQELKGTAPEGDLDTVLPPSLDGGSESIVP